jgi:hypothetical protein
MWKFGGLMCGTPAARRYQRRSLVAMMGYLLVLFGTVTFVRHGHPQGWSLYLCSALPAIPIIAVIGTMARYLKEETDEYQRLMIMRSLLVGTAALLGMVVISDFLRSFANLDPFPPFICFMVFALSFGITNAVQKLQNRAPADE